MKCVHDGTVELTCGKKADSAGIISRWQLVCHTAGVLDGVVEGKDSRPMVFHDDCFDLARTYAKLHSIHDSSHISPANGVHFRHILAFV